MKTFWSILAKILLLVVVIQAWFLYDHYHSNQQLTAENLQLEQELLQTKDALLAAEEKAVELEKKSLEGMVKETNKAVVSGWEKLLQAVEDELDKARESISELAEPASPEEASSEQMPSDSAAKEADSSSSPEQNAPKNESESQESDIPVLPNTEAPVQGERT